MKIVCESLLTLKAHFMPKVVTRSPNAMSPKSFQSDSFRWKHIDEHSGTSEGFQEDTSPRKVHRALRNPGTFYLIPLFLFSYLILVFSPFVQRLQVR